MNQKKIKFIGRLNNYKKYPKVKGARNFTYFDENYGYYGAGMTNFYPTIGVANIIVPLFLQILCTFKGIYFGGYFDLGLILGWIADSLLKLWPTRYYSEMKIGWNPFEGVIFISVNPVKISIYKRIEKISYRIRISLFLLLFIGVVFVVGFRLPYLYHYLSFGSFCLGLFLPIVGPINRGCANYKRVKNAPNNLLLIHHNGGTYSVSESVYKKYVADSEANRLSALSNVVDE